MNRLDNNWIWDLRKLTLFIITKLDGYYLNQNRRFVYSVFESLKREFPNYKTIGKDLMRLSKDWCAFGSRIGIKIKQYIWLLFMRDKFNWNLKSGSIFFLTCYSFCLFFVYRMLKNEVLQCVFFSSHWKIKIKIQEKIFKEEFEKIVLSTVFAMVFSWDKEQMLRQRLEKFLNNVFTVTPLLSEDLKKWSVTDEFESRKKSIRETKLGDVWKSAG